MKNKEALILRDKLAIDRTVLANERTLLSYFRSFVVMISSGAAILKVELLEELETLGFVLVIIAPLLLLIGIVRYFRVRKVIKHNYD
jgi:putative membrane protein